MESTGSCTRSTAPASNTSLQSLAIRDEGNKVAQQGPTSSRPPSSASKKKAAPEMIPEFKCLHCPRTFKTARARGGHLKAHKHRRQLRQNQKEHRLRSALAGPQVRVWSSMLHVPSQRKAYFNFHTQLFNSHYFPSSARPGVVSLFAGTGTGGLAPAQPSSAANGYFGIVGGGAQVGNGGNLGILREVNQGETAHRIHYFPSLRSSAVPLFLSQTGSGTSSLPQPLFATPATAAEGNGGTGDGVYLGGQKQDMPQVNQEETTDGIDLTLRL